MFEPDWAWALYLTKGAGLRDEDTGHHTRMAADFRNVNKTFRLRVAEANKSTRIAPDFGSPSRRAKGGRLSICAFWRNAEGGPKDKQDGGFICFRGPNTKPRKEYQQWSLYKPLTRDFWKAFSEPVVSFDRRERTLYGHDTAEIPSLVKPLVGSTVPDAVVQPASEEELVALVRWAQENRIALTPRGRATSGYGGVLPVKGGLVVDFFHLSKLLEIDTKTLTARVQPGICWEMLDRELAKKELTLRLYPSSYPASTVGGWLAQGGAGFGSYESGWFRDNVVSARGVLADGTIREFSGADLDLVSDAEGTTGLISEVTVKVMPKEELGVISIGCPDAYDLQRLVERIVKEELPIWSLSFISPRMAEMKNRAPLRSTPVTPSGSGSSSRRPTS